MWSVHRGGSIGLGLEGRSGIWGRGKHMSKGLEVRSHIVLLRDDGWSFLGKASGGRKRLAWERLRHRSCDEAWHEHPFLSSFTYSALSNSLYKHGSTTQQIRESWLG